MEKHQTNREKILYFSFILHLHSSRFGISVVSRKTKRLVAKIEPEILHDYSDRPLIANVIEGRNNRRIPRDLSIRGKRTTRRGKDKLKWVEKEASPALVSSATVSENDKGFQSFPAEWVRSISLMGIVFPTSSFLWVNLWANADYVPGSVDCES